METKMISIRTPKNLADWIEKEAADQHRSVSGQIIFLLDKAREEDSKKG